MHDAIVIGDVHGDGDRLIHVLGRLRLATPDAVWTGGTVALIVMGDVLDGKSRDPSDREFVSTLPDFAIVRYLEALRLSAAQSGGSVTCLKGNHEVMNLMGQFGYVHPADMERCGGPQQRREIFGPRGEVGKLVARWKRIHIDNGVLFCHAGVHTDYANDIVGAGDIARGAKTVPNHHLLEHRQYAVDAYGNDELVKLRAMLRRCGCRLMMIGHNTVARPQAVWAGTVVQTDAGLSRAYGDSGKVFVLCVRPDSSWETIEIAL